MERLKFGRPEFQQVKRAIETMSRLASALEEYNQLKARELRLARDADDVVVPRDALDGVVGFAEREVEELVPADGDREDLEIAEDLAALKDALGEDASRDVDTEGK